MLFHLPSETALCIRSCRKLHRLSFQKKWNENIKNWDKYLQNTKRVILYKEKKCLWPNFFKIFIDVFFSRRVHANLTYFFLIDSLDVTLQKYIFNIPPRLTMATIGKKLNGGRNLWNTLYTSFFEIFNSYYQYSDMYLPCLVLVTQV